MANLFDKLQSEIEGREQQAGISPADLLTLSPELRKVIKTLMRSGTLNLEEIASRVDLPSDEVQGLMDALSERGYVTLVEADEEARYKVTLTHKRGRELPLNIWENLDSKLE